MSEVQTTALMKGESGSRPRILLRRMREVMADQHSAQERLDTIVREIASNMSAEVCSFYVMRSDDVLELFATQGLNRGAVHEAALRVGQGLVGTIAATARTLNLDDAQRHPAFRYLPETGEEIYNSFLGVPVLRSGRALGVVVVQNQEKRTYREDEVEALETVAMVLAEFIAAGELEGLDKQGRGLDLSRPQTLKGVPLADGIGLGHVVLHEPRVVVTNLFNEDAEYETRRLHQSLAKLRFSIDDMLQQRDVARDGEHREVLEAYRMFAHDRGWVRRMEEQIRNGLTAEAAVEKVQSDNRARMMRHKDPYLRERMNDFDDLAYRLLRELVGKPHGPLSDTRDGDYVVVARHMGAAELLDYKGPNLRGVVLEEGAPASHVVIVARALGIPVVGQVADALSVSEVSNPIIVDGEEGIAFLRPTEEVQDAYSEKVQFRAKRQAVYAKLRDRPAITKDGQEIGLLMNAGLMMDLPNVENSGAAGIGLFRTELQFMVASRFPRAGEQEQLYRDVIEAADGKPVTFRTLDVGGDKVLPYLRGEQEENPALGWRAIRLSLDRPGLLRAQLRALLRGAADRELRVMIPMVTEVREMQQVRDLIAREVSLLTRFGHRVPKSLSLGAMVEVPSLLYQLDDLLPVVDFISVGSNDLFQFVFASDRGNARIAKRYDVLNRAFLRILRDIAAAGEKHCKPVTLCGEMAGRPLAALALLGLGYRSISMASASIGPVKATILETDVGKLKPALLAEIEKTYGGQTIREFLIDFADANGIPH